MATFLQGYLLFEVWLLTCAPIRAQVSQVNWRYAVRGENPGLDQQAVMHNQDTFVGLVAIGLGVVTVVGAAQPERLVRLSKMAQVLQENAGRRTVVLVYGAIGLFLIGVGISLIL